MGRSGPDGLIAIALALIAAVVVILYVAGAFNGRQDSAVDSAGSGAPAAAATEDNSDSSSSYSADDAADAARLGITTAQFIELKEQSERAHETCRNAVTSQAHLGSRSEGNAFSWQPAQSQKARRVHRVDGIEITGNDLMLQDNSGTYRTVTYKCLMNLDENRIESVDIGAP
jgi:hypothetical protein